MASVYLQTNTLDVERIAQQFAATKTQVEKAARRAVRKLVRWVQSSSLREASRDTGIKRKILAHRLRMSMTGGQFTARVWYGLNAIPLSALEPKQTATGVTAGPVERRHAFIVHHGAKGQVYRRVHRDQRLPLAVQYENIADEFRRVLLTDINPRFERMFSKYFEQELRWEVRRAA
ncbi:MAG: phage tail protein [Proteobacteria bacterium]|nr:phage tail protein [Pseudomonadota bacterium]